MTAIERAGPVRLVVVVLPVRDEEQRLGPCLEALKLAISNVSSHGGSWWPMPRVRVMAVLDVCVDASAEVVSRYAWVEAVTSGAGRVGAARALGVRAALAGETDGLSQIWIATTDADSRVPTDWLTHQLDLAAQGADMFRGLVEPDPAECGSATFEAWSSAYRRQDGHAHVHGANLGVRADAYRLCGGFDELAVRDEDVALSRNARLRSLNVVASAQALVATSGRLTGRVEGPGFAAHLSRLAGS